MGKKRIWVVVEGRAYDTRFYDRVLRKSPNTLKAGFEIRLAEQIAHNGSTAGGKSHCLRLHDYYRRDHKLRQQTASGDRLIVFMLDKDRDDFTGRKKRSDHVIYTHHADVEAEIYAHGRLRKSLADCLSLSKPESSSLAKEIGDPLETLAGHWAEWVSLGCIASGAESRCSIKAAGESTIHKQKYGPLDLALREKAAREVHASARCSPARYKQLEARIAGVRRRGEIALYLKGKHVPGYVAWKAREYFSNRRAVNLRGLETALTTVILGSVDFNGDWVRHYHSRIEAL